MNKFVKAIFCVSVSVAIVLCACVLSACSCNPDPGPDPVIVDPSVNTYTVTFNSMGGSTVASQKVDEGKYAEEPDDPSKTGYDFNGWYAEESLKTLYSFNESPVTADITLYAGWQESSEIGGGEENAGTVTFYWNYDHDSSGTVNDSGDVYKTVKFTYGKNVSKVEAPKRAGYEFSDWYTEDGEEYNRLAKYTADVTVYAKWVIEYTFEAEETQLTGLTPNSADDRTYDTITDLGYKVGVALSGSANGKALIKESSKASGGKYVSGIEYTGAYLDFEFTSDKDESNAALSMRLSARFRTLYMSSKTASSKIDILVNGSAVSYNDITINREVDTSMDGMDCENYFQTFYIGNIEIKEGSNVIRLFVNNNSSRTDGTVRAYAPVVDCIYLKAESQLDFKAYENK